MEWIAILTSILLFGNLLYLINRIHHVNRKIAETNVHLNSLENLLFRTKWVNTDQADTRVESPSTNTVSQKKNVKKSNSLVHEINKIEVKANQSSEPVAKKRGRPRKHVFSEAQKQEIAKTSPEKVKNVLVKKKDASQRKGKPRTEEQKRLTSEKMKAWWAAKKSAQAVNSEKLSESLEAVSVSK